MARALGLEILFEAKETKLFPVCLLPSAMSLQHVHSNVNKEKQTSVNPEACFLRHEAILKAQGNIEERFDNAFSPEHPPHQDHIPGLISLERTNIEEMWNIFVI
jgi:hypothetical protein